MDLIFLAFANDRSNPLQTLQEEDTAVYDTLLPRQLKQHIMLHRDSYATIESVSKHLGQCKDDVRIFLYSGHAGRDSLELEGKSANAEGLAHLLGQCQNLKLVFLNGCSTAGQVSALLDKGVPAVMATSAPINDKMATLFSKRFFLALKDQCSIREAFDLAKAEVLMNQKDLDINVHSILGTPGGEAGDVLWGMYVRQGKEEALSWKIPMETKVAGTETFVPNTLLINTLMQALAPYKADVKAILDEEALGAAKDDLDKKEAILKAMPHPVSEQLRKLLVDEEDGGSGTTFFYKVGVDRLNQLIVIYSTMLELLGFTQLAQLWEASRTDGFTINDAQREQIKTYFNAAGSGTDVRQFLDLLTLVNDIFKSNQKACFIEEVSMLTDEYRKDTEFKDAVSYLEQLLQKSLTGSFDPEEAKEMCIITEQRLSTILKHLGFIANYTLASVKAIDILNYKHFAKPKFKHRMVILEQRFVGLAENQKIEDQVLDCNSVIIMKNSDKKQFLNLSPFVIDENAFDEKASIAKLYFFDTYSKSTNAYSYKHVYKPNDAPLLITGQVHFQVLKAQFDSFSNTIFHQPLQSI